MLVIDASALTELLLRRPAAGQVERHIEAHGDRLHAPHLIDVEVISALRRVVAAGDASPARAELAIAALIDLPVARYPHNILMRRAWELRENFSAYDATYLALAEALTDGGAPLLTADARFARAARTHSAIDVLLVI